MQAREHHLIHHSSNESPEGLFTSVLTLRFYAQPEHFFEGKMKLQCEAIISQAHTLRSEEITISNNTTKNHPDENTSSDMGKYI